MKKTGKVVLGLRRLRERKLPGRGGEEYHRACFRLSDAPPAVVGAQNWITPPFEYDKYFFPQKEWILDAINEKIMPLKGYTPVTNVTAEEQLRKLKLGV